MGIVVDPSLAVENCGVGILLKNLATLFEIIYLDRVKWVNEMGQILNTSIGLKWSI